MKSLNEFNSRFRILKGGKVSLVIAGLLLGNSLNAAVLIFTDSGLSGITLTEDSTLTIASGTHNITSGSPAVNIMQKSV